MGLQNKEQVVRLFVGEGPRPCSKPVWVVKEVREMVWSGMGREGGGRESSPYGEEGGREGE